MLNETLRKRSRVMVGRGLRPGERMVKTNVLWAYTVAEASSCICFDADRRPRRSEIGVPVWRLRR